MSDDTKHLPANNEGVVGDTAVPSGISEIAVSQAVAILPDELKENLGAFLARTRGMDTKDFLKKMDAALPLAGMMGIVKMLEILMAPDNEGEEKPKGDGYDQYSDAYFTRVQKRAELKIKAFTQIVNMLKRLPEQGIYEPSIVVGGIRFPLPIEPTDWVVVDGHLQHSPTVRYWERKMDSERWNYENQNTGAEGCCLSPASTDGKCIFTAGKPAPTKPGEGDDFT